MAVLRIDAPAAKLKAIALGQSGNLQIGQKVCAIGNPFRLDQTLTTGIVSALNREIESVTRGHGDLDRAASRHQGGSEGAARAVRSADARRASRRARIARIGVRGRSLRSTFEK